MKYPTLKTIKRPVAVGKSPRRVAFMMLRTVGLPTTMAPMPSRRRPKAPPPPPLSDVERFAQSVRESEEADRRAKQAAIDRKREEDRVRLEAVERAARLEQAQRAHQRAVELVKEAKRTGRGAVEADVAWREAKAELLELETGKRPAWAARPAEPADSQQTVGEENDGAEHDRGDEKGDG